MTIFIYCLSLLIGMFLLVKGADYFVTGAVGLSIHIKIPTLIIGLTVVAIGTSLPELAVSVTSAIKGSVDISVGNIVGANILNMLVNIGAISIIAPIAISKNSKRIDIPCMLLVTILLLLYSVDTWLNGSPSNRITRTESIPLVLIFVAYIFVLIYIARRDKETGPIETPNLKPTKPEEKMKAWKILLCILIGAVSVILGGECVTNAAKFIAIQIGMSEVLVGLTIVSFGTTLPELFTSIAAAKKGETDLAVGNVVGSNITNIALILGIVGTISQIIVSTEVIIDLLVLFVYTIIFSVMCMTNSKVTKKEGFIFIAMYVLYLAFAITRNYVGF